MKSVLARVTRSDVERDPFPHVVIDRALDEDLYRALAACMPDAATLVDGRAIENNTPYHFRAKRILETAAPLWRAFVERHTSQQFYDEVAALFQLRPAQTSIRGFASDAHAALDCQITYGSPVTHATRCHPVHVDRTVALYAGLLYFRLPDDDSRGGDLELYRFKSAIRAYDEKRIVDDALVERVKTIPYAANRLVFFPHSRDALHAVSARSVTPHPRLHVNFLAEFRENVWELAA